MDCGGARLVAAIVVGMTCLLVITGPLIESILLNLGDYNDCALVRSIKQRSITKVCVMIYAMQGSYFLLVFFLSVISILMCHGSLICDFMLSPCSDEFEEPSPRLRFREEGDKPIVIQE